MSEQPETQHSPQRTEKAGNISEAATYSCAAEVQNIAKTGLKSLTYTSFAKLDLNLSDIESIHRGARESNALNAVTGFLVFNGTHFLQIIEGPDEAIDELMIQLYRDRRHSALELRDVRKIEIRSFADWSMELVRVETSYSEAKKTISARIPSTVSAGVRDRIERFTREISSTVRLT